MSENKQPTNFTSVESLVEFFDNDDLGNYLETQPEVRFDVSRAREAAKERRQNTVVVDKAIMEKITIRAEAERTSAQALINAWLAEKILQPA